MLKKSMPKVPGWSTTGRGGTSHLDVLAKCETCNEDCIYFNVNCNGACWSLLVIGGLKETKTINPNVICMCMYVWVYIYIYTVGQKSI